jgi:hypothetical protein
MPRVATTINISNPRRYGYDVRIDDILLRSAVGPGREMQIQSSDVQEGQINVKQNPEDFTSNLGRIYSRNNFAGGQGLDTAHRANGTPKDTTRFWDSKGVDVFHGDDETSYHTHLLHTTAEELSFSNSNNYLAQTTNGDMYVTDGTTIYKSTDNGDNWSSVSTGLTINHNFTGAAAVGDQVYFTTSNGTTASELIQFNGSTWSENSTDQSSNAGLTGCWFAKGQLFISGDDGTVEYLWAVSPFNKTWSASDLAEADAILTFEDSHHVSQVVDAGAVVLAASTNGDIYSIKEDAGVYSLKGQTVIPFEEVHSIAATEGLVFFGTKEKGRDVGRFYRAELTVADNLYVLANRQLVKEWVIDGVDPTPHFMFVTRDSVYCGIKESASESYLWRYFLPTGGIARDLEMGTAGGYIEGITNSNNKFVVAVAGVDIFRETETYESTGYIITALADFYTSEKKQWVGAKVTTNVVSSGSVKLYTSTLSQDIDNVSAVTWDEQVSINAGTGGEEEVMELVSGRWIAAKIELNTDDTAQTPEFLSFAIRGYQLVNDLVVDMPINISDQIERPFRKALTVQGQGELVYQALRNKEGKNVQLEIFRPDTLLRGIIENVSAPVDEISQRGSVTTYCLVRFRGSKVIQTATSGVGLGVGVLGVDKLG